MPDIDLSGEPDWEPLVLPPGLSDLKSFVSGDPKSDRFRVRYFFEPSAERIRARVWFGPGAAGPPGHAHGGSIAAVLDETMGVACLYSGRVVLAGRLTIVFSAPLRLNQVTTVSAWIERVEGTKVHTTCVLKNENDALVASGEGIFVEIGYERFEAMLGAR